MDVFGDICQASLLHLTKAAVSFLNSFSGQIITGPEKARRGARVQSISLRLFSIEVGSDEVVSEIGSYLSFYCRWGIVFASLLGSYLVSFDNIFVCKFGRRHSFQWFYAWVPLFLGIFYVYCMKVSWVFVKQLDPS